MKIDTEVAAEILQHVTKFQQDPEYRRECRKNQVKEIIDMETEKSQDSN